MHHYDSTLPYPRDLMGYGPTPPHAKYGAINECLRLRTQRPAQGLAHAYRFDTCSCNKIGKTQSGNFYFG